MRPTPATLAQAFAAHEADAEPCHDAEVLRRLAESRAVSHEERSALKRAVPLLEADELRRRGL